MKNKNISPIFLLAIVSVILTSCNLTKEDEYAEEIKANKEREITKTGFIERVQSKTNQYDNTTFYLTLEDDSVVYKFDEDKENGSSVRKSLLLAQKGDSIVFAFKDLNSNKMFDANDNCLCGDNDEIISWSIFYPKEKVAEQPLVVASQPVSIEKPKVVYRYRDRKPVQPDTVFLPTQAQLSTNIESDNPVVARAPQSGFTVRTDQTIMSKIEGVTTPYLEKKKYDEKGKYIGLVRIDPITLEELK